MSRSAGVREYLLALADDEHMVGARHTSWIGLGPFLEEDLAFCSIAQDELGHAIGLYQLLLADVEEVKEAGSDLDEFALRREPMAYRSSWLAEIECSEWSDSLVRHWLYDRAEQLRWRELERCSDDAVAAFARRASSEERFHLLHAEQFMSRVAATDGSGRIRASIDRLLPLGIAAWTPVLGEADAIAEGFVEHSSSQLATEWATTIREDLARWGVEVVWPTEDAVASLVAAHAHRHVRSDGFDQLHADITKVIVVDPAATW